MEFKCTQCGQCCAKFDADDGGIIIFEWEKENLEKVARKNNIEFKIEPGQTDYDAKSNTKIITTFAFKAKSCPYLKDKKCSIHPDRPFYCRAYPLLITMTKKKFDLKLLACPNAKIPELGLKEYYQSFGEIFLQALELEIFRHHYIEIISSLKKNNLLDIKQRPKANAKTMTLFEFLIKNKFLLKKDADKIIDDIINLRNAKAMVRI